eukprot:TRINITY_DN28708_c0_g1_i2.p1 TRINITY_DN28708_c0_g1~~TRINITY_DN28708_c0_g1_i2.p1  ORF type:complete len:288 (+),score=63.29 TRINITY_DN28708_c0_g1_i2:65-928(+)
MGNCCTNRDEEEQGRSIEKLVRKQLQQLSDSNSELRRLPGRLKELKDAEDAAAKERSKDDLRAGDVVMVDVGGDRGRAGDVEEETEPGVFRIRWAGANPKYAPPELVPRDKITLVTPKNDVVELQEANVSAGGERAKIFQPEILAIWDEYVGGGKLIMSRAQSDYIVREYIYALKAYIFDIWMASYGRNVDSGDVKKLESRLRQHLLTAVSEMQAQAPELAALVWNELPAGHHIDIDTYTARYFMCLSKHVSLRTICGRGLARAASNAALSDLLRLTNAMVRDRYRR